MPASRIALIHAVAAAIPPVRAAFARTWPEAQVTSLLDDSLPADRAAEGAELSPAMAKRIADLAYYVAGTGADAILFTCSASGPAIEAVARDLAPLPVQAQTGHVRGRTRRWPAHRHDRNLRPRRGAQGRRSCGGRGR
ncbi:MAG: Asp/Glu/hydantoin racemase [Roseomonas sp.]|nr:Asp/Glu/hydantoin racemase [Roseomonas sp.]